MITYPIRYINGLLITNDLVPMGSKNSWFVEEFTRNKVGKNYKGLVISQIKHPTIKWTTIIVVIYFTTSSQPLDVKKEMSKGIKNIPYDVKRYNWANHVIGLLKVNY